MKEGKQQSRDNDSSKFEEVKAERDSSQVKKLMREFHISLCDYSEQVCKQRSSGAICFKAHSNAELRRDPYDKN